MEMQQFETRSGLPVEVREGETGLVVEGYAALFDTPTNIGDAFIEQIARGAFKSALERGDDVEFLINHGGLPIARSTAGNLYLEEDDKGLKMRAVLDRSDPDVMRIVPKMRAGMLDQMSFAFQATGQRWDTPAEGMDVRTITDVMLYDVSVVNRGAYPDTSIALRSREEAGKGDDAERREAWSRRKAIEDARRAAEQEQKFRQID
jgi:HK97 family phage prohead protease